jgi:hypothetical protein
VLKTPDPSFATEPQCTGGDPEPCTDCYPEGGSPDGCQGIDGTPNKNTITVTVNNLNNGTRVIRWTSTPATEIYSSAGGNTTIATGVATDDFVNFETSGLSCVNLEYNTLVSKSTTGDQCCCIVTDYGNRSISFSGVADALAGGTSTFITFTGGSGTVGDPYIITMGIAGYSDRPVGICT